jgi:hypothetical protein
MQLIDQISLSTANAPAEHQQTRTLFVATCRANPASNNSYDDSRLDGGDYQVAWAYPGEAQGDQPISFTYGDWTLVSQREPPNNVATLLPAGDVLVVVHGFNETAPEGMRTGQKLDAGLAPQQRTASIASALGAQPPTSQEGALRLAKTFQNRLPALTRSQNQPRRVQPLYQHLIAFTWPCARRVFPGYLLDKEEVARFAAFSLANLLADLRAAAPNRRVLLVAHRMGCFLTIKALNVLSVLRAAQTGSGEPGVIVDQMAFYAADVNADALQCDPLPAHPGADDTPGALALARRRSGYGFQALDRVGRLTIYFSFHDNALVWSPFANLLTEESDGWAGRARLGWCGPYWPDQDAISNTHPNVVAVDCSACIYDHAAYFIRHEVLAHTALTVAADIPTSPQPACRAAPLPTTAESAQQAAARLWAWYTPAEIARERWERFFLYKSRRARRLAVGLGWLLTIGIIAGIIFGLLKLLS